MLISENIIKASKLNPDYLGFIFWKKSPRYFNKKIPLINKRINLTGIFVNESLNEIKKQIKNHKLSVIQLHGNESPSFCEKIKTLGIKCIKSFSIDKDFNFSRLKNYEDVCDYFLFDTKGKLPGGNSYKFDWKLLEKYTFLKPFILSGGIGLKDISEIKKVIKSDLPIHAIDVNSKFEISPGNKNIELLKKFKLKLF
mgnify:FL=1